MEASKTKTDTKGHTERPLNQIVQPYCIASSIGKTIRKNNCEYRISTSNEDLTMTCNLVSERVEPLIMHCIEW